MAGPGWKDDYTTRNRLDQSYLDIEIPISEKFSFTLFQILTFLASCIFLITIVSNEYFMESGIIYQVLLSAWWILFTVFILRSIGKQKKITVLNLGQLWEFVASNIMVKKIPTYVDSKAAGFYFLAKIQDIQTYLEQNMGEERAVIIFSNGDYGRFYEITGRASRYTFTEERRAITAEIDAFFRTLDVGTTLSVVEVLRNQQVHANRVHLKEAEQHLRDTDKAYPGRLVLAYSYDKVLADYVGGYSQYSRGFESRHQYLMVRASSLESMRRADILLAQEADSPYMFNSLNPATLKETNEILKTIYA